MDIRYSFSIPSIGICDNSCSTLQIIYANYFFTAAFTLEVLLQALAKNFILGPNGMTSIMTGWIFSQELHCRPEWKSIIDIPLRTPPCCTSCCD